MEEAGDKMEGVVSAGVAAPMVATPMMVVAGVQRGVDAADGAAESSEAAARRAERVVFCAPAVSAGPAVPVVPRVSPRGTACVCGGLPSRGARPARGAGRRPVVVSSGEEEDEEE